MTWDELTDLLPKLVENYDNLKVRRVEPTQGPETIALHIVPVAWFVAMRFTGALNIGVYKGEENRLVGTEQIPLAELTPEFVRERVDAAIDKAEATRGVQLVLDPEAVRHFFEVMEKTTLAGRGPRTLPGRGPRHAVSRAGRRKAFLRAEAPSVFRSSICGDTPQLVCPT